jgi:hypothetical protein
MLTRGILVANAALSGLTDEQITAITTLSQNDENSVIAKKTSEIYGALDADILAASGIAKNSTEKTYDFAKRVIGEFKTKAESANGLQSQIDTLTKEKARLEKAIADGSADAETAKALKQAKADLANVTTQYTELNTKFEQMKTEHEKEMFGVKIDNELQTAAAGLTFKTGLPESVTKVILAQANEKVKGMNPEYIDDGKGGKILAFKDASGAIMRNPNNQLNPFTPGELLTKELETMGVLEPKRQQPGGGTEPPKRQPGGGSITVDASGAKTRTEAYDVIANSLMQQGLTIGSKAFDDAMKQAWQDNNISQLPEK